MLATRAVDMQQRGPVPRTSREEAVAAFSLHPGVVATPMLDKLPPATLKQWCKGQTPCPLTADEGAATPTYLAAADLAKEVPHASHGKFFVDCKQSPSVMAERVLSMGPKAAAQYQSDVFDLLGKWAGSAAPRPRDTR